jgi:hypothetical protein
MRPTVGRRRLRNQAITGAPHRTPADVVRWLGAVQAQEYGPAKWALALRMAPGARDADIERAFDAGRILRTHVMRPTWHFVTPDAIRWMLELTAPRVHMRMAPYNRHLELDAATLARACGVIERALGDGRVLTRVELGKRLTRAGIAAAGQRLAHIALHAELERVVCSGPRRDRQFTYALLDERAPRARRLARDEALGALAVRFLRSHGPATVRDFVWWSGLLTSDATRAFAIARARSEAIDGLTYWSLGDAGRRDRTREREVHLLPVYDEYLVAYRDRKAVPHRPAGTSAPAGRLAAFQHAVVIGGQVAGVWRVTRAAAGHRLEVDTAGRLSRAERDGLHAAAARYSETVGVPVTVVFR